MCMYALVCFNFDEMGARLLKMFNVSHYCLSRACDWAVCSS